VSQFYSCKKNNFFQGSRVQSLVSKPYILSRGLVCVTYLENYAYGGSDQSFRVTSTYKNNDPLALGTRAREYRILVGLTLHCPNPNSMNSTPPNMEFPVSFPLEVNTAVRLKCHLFHPIILCSYAMQYTCTSSPYGVYINNTECILYTMHPPVQQIHVINISLSIRLPFRPYVLCPKKLKEFNEILKIAGVAQSLYRLTMGWTMGVRLPGGG
jgi:hypothetical protein